VAIADHTKRMAAWLPIVVSPEGAHPAFETAAHGRIEL
jgi:hypothetical protein